MSTPARILMVEGDTVPPAPTNGQILFYAKTSGTFFSLNSLGVETPLGGGSSVTSVSVTTANGVSGVVANPTTTPAITLTLGAITPSSVAAVGTVSGSNLSGTHTGSSSGTNTGDQTITLTGDVTGSGGGSFAATLSATGVTAGSYTNANITVDSKGRIISASNGSAGGVSSFNTRTGAVTLTSGDVTTALGFTPGSGTVTSVAASGSQGITIGGSPITTSGTITIGLGAITPTSVAAVGSVSGLNLSGTNTGDQTSVSGNAGTATTLQTGRTLAITGDLAWTSPTFNGSANVTAAGTLATVNSNVGSFGSATQVPVFTVNAKGLVTAVSNVTITAGSGTVTSVGATGSADITVGGSPITTSGTLTFALANTAVIPGSYTNSNVTVDAKGRITSISNGSGGSGTVTSASVTATSDITGTVATPTTTPAISLNLTTTGVSAATYGSATQVPVFAVDSKGRITSVTNTVITGGTSAPETVVFRYSAGGSGNFTPVDAIFSQTSGVTTTVTDGANCIATFAFTGKAFPPKSIILYGQNFVLNTFSIVTGSASYGAAVPNIRIAGGGTSATPDLTNGIFSATNVVTLQLRMSDTGASSTIGNRAWLMVQFGF